MVGKKRLIISTIIISLGCATAILFGKNVLAEGAESTDDGGTTGSDRACTTGVCYGEGLGGGWKWYAVTSDHIVIPDEVVGPKTFIGGSLDGCQKDGATDFLRLAPALWSNGGDTFEKQLGLMQVWRFESEGYTYRADLGGITQSEAFMHFLAADALDGVRDGRIKGGDTWNDVSAFCYKPGEEKILYGDTSFWTQSRVSVGGEEITGGKTVTSERNGKVTLKFSTDKDSVTVDFSHIVGFDHGSFSMNSNDTTVGDTVTTKWSVSGAYSVGEHSSSTWRPDSNHEEIPDAAKNSVTITFAPGETEKKKCSTIKYTRREVKLTGSPVTGCVGWACSVDHYDYTAAYNGSEDSEACVEVTRPNPPSGEPKSPAGGVDGSIMFAGETAKLWWKDIKFTSIETRRLAEWQAIKFLVGSGQGYDAGKLKVEPNTNQDPCALYNSRFNIAGGLCQVHESGSWNTDTSSTHAHEYGVEAPVKVPNNIGDKYCNSFGYKLEYWYGIEGSKDASDNGWHRDRSYWHDYNAACRTIAKRPSAAVWNGSLLTQGEINTSLAQRHNNIAFGSAPDSDRTLFGSWSEYLIASNAPSIDAAHTMASGAALSKGSAKQKLCDGRPWETNSALTISNFDDNIDFCALRSSGIIANSTFITRLNAYLRNVSEHNSGIVQTDIASLYGGVTGNKVVIVNGDLNITSNIEANGNYTIHNAPQAIIFVKDGNVNISSNVTRIDAWIIVTVSGDPNRGIIYTCSEFSPGSTRSDSAGISSSDNCAKQLIFNGPVIARQVKLQRSFGADNMAKVTTGLATDGSNGFSDRQSSGEIFNLRADAYLWGYAQASRYSSSYQEVYSRELAPRY